MSFPESRVQLLRSPIPDSRLGGGELLFDVFADQPLVRSANASLSARQLSRSTPTPGCPRVSATVIRAL